MRRERAPALRHVKIFRHPVGVGTSTTRFGYVRNTSSTAGAVPLPPLGKAWLDCENTISASLRNNRNFAHYMKAEVILCLPQWGKVPSLSRRMRGSAAYAAGSRTEKKSRKRLFFGLRRRHSPTRLGAAMSPLCRGLRIRMQIARKALQPYFHTAIRISVQRKRAALRLFFALRRRHSPYPPV